MVLLTLLAVGMLSLSSVSLRDNNHSRAKATARANARLALMIAIGELQKYAGPDRRVTGSAGLTGEDQENPNWMGVWDTGSSDTKPAWLVSGNETRGLKNLDSLHSYPGGYHTPESSLPDDQSIILHTGLNGASNRDEVRVARVDVESGSHPGRYAWSISDEGTKARIDVAAPDTDPPGNLARVIRSRTPQEPGLSHVGPMLEPLRGEGNSIDRKQLISLPSLDLALENEQAARTYFHHLTTGGAGLPVNVVDGGMKNDLSVVFDSSQMASTHLEGVMGAKPRLGKVNGATIFKFDVSAPERFYLSENLSRNGGLPVGPNWGILYNYAQLWQTADDHQMPVVRLDPNPDTNLRTNDWAPYNNVDEGSFARDNQHTNSGVYPVVGMLQMGFRLSAEKVNVGRRVGYQMQLQMKPLVGIWNPYNVRIKKSSFNFVWALYPYLRLGIIPPEKGQYTHEIWMRESWMSGDVSDRGVENGLDKYFNLTTEEVDLEPGEFRLFSVGTRTQMGSNNRLVSTWNEDGAFTIDLNYSKKYGSAEAGDPIIVPEGTVAWYGDLFIEDYQHPSTEKHFGDKYSAKGISASWFAMRSGGNLHRISDIWQTPTPQQRDNLPYVIPEQVISEWARTGVTAAKLPVEQFAETPYHIGTWRWFSRTASEADKSQSARGWVDTNPRYAASNPKWDGSRIGGRNRNRYEGWNFISTLLGASYDDTYDGGPPGRGKIAEGQNEVASFPEAVRKNGRYQGHTGFSTSSAGQTHVAIFDVPRTPLVSIGQFQHAHLARYGFEPGFVFGNSYANPRIPLDQTMVENFAGIDDFRMVDISHATNEAIWDDCFFSTIGKDYMGGGRGSLDKVMPFKAFANGDRQLTNSRHRLRPLPGDDSFDTILEEAGENGARAIAARILVEGAFNVNSTSKEAWKAVLSSMADFEMPVLSADGSSAAWETPEGIRFPRFGHLMDADGWEPSDGPRDPSYWRGFRQLSAGELDKLAEEIVVEVRERGPFRSFADFVNRDPDSDRELSQRKGALQAALDRAINNQDAGTIGNEAALPNGSLFSNAAKDESESAGHAGYLLQGDILQNLAPIMQVRSDYFRIRAMGEATDKDGKVIARQYCEAYVQRVPEYLDSEDQPEVMADELDSEVNRLLGRR
ncbi:MAG: hypothetical protein ACPG4K_00235, partial [Haloferula sp.]